jgi:hypothetical protein
MGGRESRSLQLGRDIIPEYAQALCLDHRHFQRFGSDKNLVALGSRNEPLMGMLVFAEFGEPGRGSVMAPRDVAHL